MAAAHDCRCDIRRFKGPGVPTFSKPDQQASLARRAQKIAIQKPNETAEHFSLFETGRSREAVPHQFFEPLVARHRDSFRIRTVMVGRSSLTDRPS
jgi:hypothetical protein